MGIATKQIAVALNPQRQATNLWREGVRRFGKNRVAVAGAAVFFVICLLCALAPVLATIDYKLIDLDIVHARPSAAHLFGTDSLGRDLFARMLYGGRNTLRIGAVSTLLAAAAGSALGLFSGYFGGRVDFFLARVIDMISAVPVLLLVIVMEVALGWGQGNFLYAMAISATPQFARVVRASVMNIVGQEYIEAARALGVRHPGIILNHILHNVFAPLAIQLTAGFADALLTCTIMGYLGVGINPPEPEWGALVFSGKGYIRTHAHAVLIPCLAIILSVTSVNFVGNGLRDALDPREGAVE